MPNKYRKHLKKLGVVAKPPGTGNDEITLT